MLVDNQIKTARHNFILASEEFGFEFVSPFNLTDEIEVFGYISNYGSKNGVVICLTTPPDYFIDNRVVDWCKEADFHEKRTASLQFSLYVYVLTW